MPMIPRLHLQKQTILVKTRVPVENYSPRSAFSCCSHFVLVNLLRGWTNYTAVGVFSLKFTENRDRKNGWRYKSRQQGNGCFLSGYSLPWNGVFVAPPT